MTKFLHALLWLGVSLCAVPGLAEARPSQHFVAAKPSTAFGVRVIPAGLPAAGFTPRFDRQIHHRAMFQTFHHQSRPALLGGGRFIAAAPFRPAAGKDRAFVRHGVRVHGFGYPFSSYPFGPGVSALGFVPDYDRCAASWAEYQSQLTSARPRGYFACRSAGLSGY